MSSPSIRHGRPGFIATFALTLLAATLVPLAQSQQPAATTAPPFPLATGTTFVIAVSNELGSTSACKPDRRTGRLRRGRHRRRVRQGWHQPVSFH